MASDSTTVSKDITEFLTQYAGDIQKEDNGLLMVTILIFGAFAIFGSVMVARYYVRKERRDQEERVKQLNRDREFKDKQLDREQAFRDRTEIRNEEERKAIQSSRHAARAEYANIVISEVGKLSKEFDTELKQLRAEMQSNRDNITSNGFSIDRLKEDEKENKEAYKEIKESFERLEAKIESIK